MPEPTSEYTAPAKRVLGAEPVPSPEAESRVSPKFGDVYTVEGHNNNNPSMIIVKPDGSGLGVIAIIKEGDTTRYGLPGSVSIGELREKMTSLSYKDAVEVVAHALDFATANAPVDEGMRQSIQNIYPEQPAAE